MALLEISDEQINAQFAGLHARNSPMRAMAEAGRPGSADECDIDDFDANETISRFEKNVDYHVGIFGNAVNTMAETSRKNNEPE